MNYELAVNRLRKGFAWMEEVDYSRTPLGASVTVHTHITRHLPCLFGQDWPFLPEDPINVDAADTDGRRLAVLRLAGIPILVNSGSITWAHLSGMRFFSTSPFCKRLNAVTVKNNTRPKYEIRELLNECLPYRSSWSYSYRFAHLSWGSSKPYGMPLIDVLSEQLISFKDMGKDTYLLDTTFDHDGRGYVASPKTKVIGLPLVALIPFDDQLAALSECMLHCSGYTPATDRVAFHLSEILPSMTTSARVLGTLDHRPCPWGPPSKWSPK